MQATREDLDHIFLTAGVAALIGHTYTDTKNGLIFATGETIRGLADLEAKERERRGNFAMKAVAAGWLSARRVQKTTAWKERWPNLYGAQSRVAEYGVPGGARAG